MIQGKILSNQLYICRIGKLNDANTLNSFSWIFYVFIVFTMTIFYKENKRYKKRKCLIALKMCFFRNRLTIIKTPSWEYYIFQEEEIFRVYYSWFTPKIKKDQTFE